MFVLYSIEKEIDSIFDTIQKCVFSPNAKCIVIDLKYFAWNYSEIIDYL